MNLEPTSFNRQSIYFNYCMAEILSLWTYFVTYLVVTLESKLYIFIILTANRLLTDGNSTTIRRNT